MAHVAAHELGAAAYAIRAVMAASSEDKKEIYSQQECQVSTGISDLFWAYEIYPARLTDSQFNLSESGNGVLNLLDEARWELPINATFANQCLTAARNVWTVVNTGRSAVTLSNVKMRYYYTKDGTQSETFWCDYSPMAGALQWGVEP